MNDLSMLVPLVALIAVIGWGVTWTKLKQQRVIANRFRGHYLMKDAMGSYHAAICDAGHAATAIMCAYYLKEHGNSLHDALYEKAQRLAGKRDEQASGLDDLRKLVEQYPSISQQYIKQANELVEFDKEFASHYLMNLGLYEKGAPYYDNEE